MFSLYEIKTKIHLISLLVLISLNVFKNFDNTFLEILVGFLSNFFV